MLPESDCETAKRTRIEKGGSLTVPAFQALHRLGFFVEGAFLEALPVMPDPQGYAWRTPSFYQDVKNCREAPAITATRSHCVLNCFRAEINAWLCRRMPGIWD